MPPSGFEGGGRKEPPHKVLLPSYFLTVADDAVRWEEGAAAQGASASISHII